MKLLFTFDENGNDDLKELLGFSHADFKIKNLKSDIISATDELVKLIGRPIYDSVVGIFESNSSSATDAELLMRTRLAIILNAYRNYAPDNDLRHTTNGRVVNVEENQKQPWEWQIERSNKSLERKYYRALDALLEFLDNSVSGWKETAAFKKTHALFVRSTEDFNDYFDIERSRLLLIKLNPGLRIAENSEIKARIGSRYDELKTKLKSAVALTDAESLLLDKIKEACVYMALSWGLRRLSVQLFPEGVLQYKSSDRLTINAKSAPIKSETEGAAQQFDIDAAKALAEIEKLVAVAKQINITEARPVKPYYDSNDNFITT